MQEGKKLKKILNHVRWEDNLIKESFRDFGNIVGNWGDKKNHFLLLRLTYQIFASKCIMTGIKLTWHWKVRDQIDTIERLGAKLTYGVKERDQLCNLPKNERRLTTKFWMFWYFRIINKKIKDNKQRDIYIQTANYLNEKKSKPYNFIKNKIRK